nr:hypothetical protein [uncultured Lichenicoccus sp.]
MSVTIGPAAFGMHASRVAEGVLLRLERRAAYEAGEGNLLAAIALYRAAGEEHEAWGDLSGAEGEYARAKALSFTSREPRDEFEMFYRVELYRDGWFLTVTGIPAGSLESTKDETDAQASSLAIERARLFGRDYPEIGGVWVDASVENTVCRVSFLDTESPFGTKS